MGTLNPTIPYHTFYKVITRKIFKDYCKRTQCEHMYSANNTKQITVISRYTTGLSVQSPQYYSSFTGQTVQLYSLYDNS